MKVVGSGRSRRAETLKSITVRPLPQSSALILVTCGTRNRSWGQQKNTQKEFFNVMWVKEKNCPFWQAQKSTQLNAKSEKRSDSKKINTKGERAGQNEVASKGK